jgi:hypothetical protein
LAIFGSEQGWDTVKKIKNLFKFKRNLKDLNELFSPLKAGPQFWKQFYMKDHNLFHQYQKKLG